MALGLILLLFLLNCCIIVLAFTVNKHRFNLIETELIVTHDDVPNVYSNNIQLNTLDIELSNICFYIQEKFSCNKNNNSNSNSSPSNNVL